MPKKTHGLGRGLDALLPDGGDTGTAVQEISLAEIDPNPGQPRRTFSEESIAALAQSIRDQGVLQPILVTPVSGRYRIVAGERRWRAARLAGLDRVPCLVRPMDERQEMEVSLIENLQREDLDPMETAQGLRALMDGFGYTQEEAAARVAMSRPAVANFLRLLTLPERVQDMVRAGTLSAGHARVLAGVRPEERQIALAERTQREDLSVRALEALAAGKPERPKRKKQPLPVELAELQRDLQEATGLRATLTGSENSGRIVLEYYSRGELEHLWEIVHSLDGAGT